MASVSFQSVRVATGDDEEGLLVLVDGRLAGVLVQLSNQHAELAGHWFLEAAFGPTFDMTVRPTFPSLETAQGWSVQQLH